MGQPNLVKNLEKKFGKHMQDIWSHKTPGTHKFLIMRPMIYGEKISAKDQWEYKSAVGMLLYLVKHSCPNLANVTIELSKANDGANPTVYKELLSVIRYVLDTKNLWLKIESMGNSNKPYKIVCFSDSDYAGGPVSRSSIHGIILYELGILVSWQSKSKKSVLLSSSEVEYVALSEAVKEEMFMIQLLGRIKMLLNNESQ